MDEVFPFHICITRQGLTHSSLNIFVWSVALCCHAACTSFGGLFAVRFILGMCEGAITAGRDPCDM